YGKMVEEGPTRSLVSSPKHPYTQKLMANVLGLKKASVTESEGEQGPSPTGCIYSKVCPAIFEKCSTSPPMIEVGPEATAACFLYEKGG
ncbi:MAG: ABC transporter ATP-binding protein, partial [Thaumarchaeota archaeon]|nr:ABC transporter ATP-binding protein [Nitrososphaerota archaeon]